MTFCSRAIESAKKTRFTMRGHLPRMMRRSACFGLMLASFQAAAAPWTISGEIRLQDWSEHDAVVVTSAGRLLVQGDEWGDAGFAASSLRIESGGRVELHDSAYVEVETTEMTGGTLRVSAASQSGTSEWFASEIHGTSGESVVEVGGRADPELNGPLSILRTGSVKVEEGARLNLRATERIRTSVTSGENSTRMVNFDVGIALTQRLENLGLQFILEAPEDAAMQEELARMGEEEKAKQAVSMLVTGMYLAGGSSGTKTNLNMGDALNSFLQSEINNIAGSALKTIDINFGMESYDEDGDGSKRTDYSFRFAKRFYNDRIRVVLGGRISTGADINQGQAQPFIDDVSIEYRLDASGTRYVKLFHNKDYESLLEGELTETGAGIVLRKKMKRMRELFIFRRNKPKEEKTAEPASTESN